MKQAILRYPGFLRSLGSVFILAVLAAVFFGIPSLGRTQTARGATVGIRVIGLVAISPKSARGNANLVIEIPDANVELLDLRTGRVVATAVSGLDGRFDVRAPVKGAYRVCASVIGARGCGGRLIVSQKEVWARTITIATERPVLFGRVLTGDGRACWARDSFFGLDFSTQVAGRDLANGAVAGPVRANVEGEYALFPRSAGRYAISASCENSKARVGVAVGNLSVRQDLAFANHAPRIRSMQALSSAGKSQLQASAGSSLTVAAEALDPDGDAVEYLWRSAESGNAPQSTSVGKQAWALPSVAATHVMYMLARDGKGGYNYQRFVMPNESDRVSFSGRVIDEVSRQPVSGAEVSVGSVQVRSDANGWFRLEAKARSDNDYVLNIRHTNFALMSRIYEQGQDDVTYDLIRTEVSTLPAGAPLRFSDTGSSGPCGTFKGERAVAVKGLAPARFIGIDSLSGNPGEAKALRDRFLAKYREQSARAQRPCKPRGVEISMPDGALVGNDGRRAVGPITSSLATLNPTRRALPGNYRAMTASGDSTELLSFGAVYAEFRDSAGRLLNLAPGAKAELVIPVPDGQAASAQPTIQLWSYNEETGQWIEEGTANLVMTATGPAYVGKTKHFSTINMDIALSGGTCARLHVPPGTFTGWNNLLLRAYVSFGTDSKVKEVAISAADEYHALFRLPQGPATAPNTVRLEVTGTNGAGPPLVLLNDVVNIDGLVAANPGSATSGDLSYPPQYAECSTVELAPPTSVMPDYGLNNGADATGRPYFLTGPQGTFNPVGFDPNTYYAVIDPGTPTRDTLGKWWVENGFGPNGLTPVNTGYTRASYMNHNDLGFGRDMHCIETDNPSSTLDNLACYVSNYGGPDQIATNADDAVAADRTKALATVTMEFDPAAPVGQRVQFYAYAGGQAGGPRIGFADLDGFGPKPIPQLCTVCHGGTYDDVAGRAVDSKFREFDLPSLRYSGNRSWDFFPSSSSSALSTIELGNFARLNNMVLNSEPQSGGVPTDTLGKLIRAWYPSFVGGPAPVRPAAPASWPNDSTNMPAGTTFTWQDIYHGPYAQSCRTCHVARGFDLNSKAQYRFTAYAVCNTPRIMPNAVITYRNFWATRNNVLATNLVRQFEDATNTTANTCQN